MTTEGLAKGTLISILLFLLTVTLLSQSGCQREPKMKSIIIRGHLYYLKPVDQSVPIDLKKVELIACPERERAGIALCLGQIAATNLDIRKVIVAWPEQPMAARIDVGIDTYIYLARGSNGTWNVVGTSAYDR
jgi:hypothetical protein